jgi:hypothetical protein
MNHLREATKNLSKQWLDGRAKFWFWLKEEFGAAEGEILPTKLRILHAFIFPVMHTRDSTNNWTFAYSPMNDTVRILGVEYSMELFRHFRAGGIEEPFSIVKREDSGVVVIRKIYPVQHSDTGLRGTVQFWLRGKYYNATWCNAEFSPELFDIAFKDTEGLRVAMAAGILDAMSRHITKVAHLENESNIRSN